MINITSNLFLYNGSVILGYNGRSYKKGDKIEINSEDLKNFNSVWLTPIEKEKISVPNEVQDIKKTPKPRGRRKKTE